MPTDVVMTLIAAILVVAFIVHQGANRLHVAGGWVLGLYCGSISWIGPNVRHFFAFLMGLIAAHLHR
jgi:hypothetical protein